MTWPWLAPVTCLLVFGFCVGNYMTRTGVNPLPTITGDSNTVAEARAYAGTLASCDVWNIPPDAADLSRASHSLSITGSVPSIISSVLKTNF
jgi:hypothetical protein